MVGYDDNIRGYVMWDPEGTSRSIYRSADVQFLPEAEGITTQPAYAVSDDEPDETYDSDDASDGEAHVVNATGTSQSYCPPNEMSFRDAMSGPDRAKWLDAMNDELNAMSKNNVWTLVDRPPGTRVISSRWVLRVKTTPDGVIERYRARFVARGFTQREGIDYHETFAPVTRFDTVRLLIAYAAQHRMKLRQFDIKTAFLHGELPETIYISQPEGFSDGTNRVCKVRRSLYGLKQSPRCWNQRLVEFMTQNDWVVSKFDACLFINHTLKLILAIYVDDGLLAYTDEASRQQFETTLTQQFEAKFTPADCFLGIEIQHQPDGGYHLHQRGYATKVIERFNLARAKPRPSPYDAEDINYESPKCTDQPYREAVGSLLYLVNCTRPDLAFSVSVASRYLQAPTEQHWRNVQHILRYVIGTKSVGPLYKPDTDGKFAIYSDSDYAGDKLTRRSTSGCIVMFAGAPVHWNSRLQKTVATSSTEAEFISASEAVKECLSLRNLIDDLALPRVAPTLYVDSQPAIDIIRDPTHHSRTKHIDVRYKFIREHEARGNIVTTHVSTENQLADSLTKAYSGPRLRLALIALGLQHHA